MRHPFLESWQTLALDRAPFLLEEDRPLLEGAQKHRVSLHHNFKEYYENPDFGIPESTLHLGLIPLPYAGDMAKADIIVLILNPGLNSSDYYGEHEVPAYRQALIANLKQEGLSQEYPFPFLDPRFSWHPGFVYWHGKLRSIITELAKLDRIPYHEALRRLSGRFAFVQLVPYHSRNFSHGSLIPKLPSSQLAIRYVREVLAARACEGKALVIVTRQPSAWGLKEDKNVVVYRGSAQRGAHLSLNTSGGKAILRHLKSQAN